MLKKLIYAIVCVASIITSNASFAQVYPVDPIEKGFFNSTEPTLTFLWKAKNAKAVLIIIPGGEGQIKLTLDQKNLGGFFGNTLRPLSDPNLTSGVFDLVAFDSPMTLPIGTNYPYSRTTADHLTRIESVVFYYKEKLHKPIWLMGHSNGAVSVTEFYKYLQKNKKENLVSGIIYSSGRNFASFNSDTNLPVLFLAHEKDGCFSSTNANSQSVYNDLKKTNKIKTEYVYIKTGEAQSGDPCRSGYHMFYGASEEVYKAIDSFVSQFYK
jgi:hypothetical protein